MSEQQKTIERRMAISFCIMTTAIVAAGCVQERSGRGSPLSADEAVAIVSQLPPVTGYIDRVPGARIEVDHEEDADFVVHVYEWKDDHPATFNWFTVDKATGQVNAEFDESLSPAMESRSEWILYRSPSHDFVLWYPSTWTLDDSGETTPSLRITSPDEETIFLVATFGDKRLKEPGGIEAVLKDIEDVLMHDSAYTFDQFEPWQEDGDLLLGGYSAQGIFLDDSGETDFFKEMGTLLRDGRGFISTARVHRASRLAYSEILDAMIGGFDPFGVPAERPETAL